MVYICHEFNGPSATDLTSPIRQGKELMESLIGGMVPSKANVSTLQPEGDLGNCICHLQFSFWYYKKSALMLARRVYHRCLTFMYWAPVLRCNRLAGPQSVLQALFSSRNGTHPSFVISGANIGNGAAVISDVDMCITINVHRLDLEQRCDHMFRHETLARDCQQSPALPHVIREKRLAS